MPHIQTNKNRDVTDVTDVSRKFRRTKKRSSRTSKVLRNRSSRTSNVLRNRSSRTSNVLRKHGGKNYKSVALFYNNKAVLCDICHSNNYYQRDSSMGRSKASNYIFGPVFGTLSVFALFCNECGLARVLKKENIFDKDNQKFRIQQINGKSIEDKMNPLIRPLKI